MEVQYPLTSTRYTSSSRERPTHAPREDSVATKPRSSSDRTITCKGRVASFVVGDKGDSPRDTHPRQPRGGADVHSD